MNSVIREDLIMLWVIVLILLIFWLLGLVGGYAMDYAIHILLLFAIFAMLIQIEDDCSNYGSCLTKKRYLKRYLINRSGKILPRRTILSGEKVSQPISSPQTYREE